MATFTVRQVLPQSVDSAGISVATTTLDTTDPRTGQMYNPTTLAAAAPVWFHRLPDGRFVGLFARRLTNAVLASPQPGGPLLYSAATDVFTPSWAVFDPATGAATGIGTIPTEVEGERVLRSAASRGNYLFVLSTIGDEALLQHFRVGTREAMVLQAEEIVPAGLGLGLFLDRNDLWLFGPLNGKLALARKNWGRVGENNSINPLLRWRYRTTRGWSFDVDDLAALPGDIPTSGPVSVARFGMRYYLTIPVYTPPVAASGTVAAVPGHWDAKTYSNRAIDARWSPHPFTVPLGGDADYTGGTAYLQPQLPLTSGHTSTPTTHGETVLDGGSDAVQVFTGLASQVVVLPAAARVVGTAPVAYRAYTLYNKTVVSDLTVLTAGGTKVATIRHGNALTLTPTVATPTLPGQWLQSTPVDRTPGQRVGFPYVATTGRRTVAGHRTLVTSWGVFEV
jgi:hypothetical protein